MLRIPKIQEDLLHLCSWKNGWGENKLADSLIATPESGLYFQDAHPLLTLENIRQAMPEDYAEKYSRWDESHTYRAGDLVFFDEPDRGPATRVYYRCLADSVAPSPVPPAPGRNWEVWSPFSDFIYNATLSGIADTVTNFIQQKKVSEETKSLLDHRTFFDGAARLRATIENKDRLVGFEITPVRALGVTTKINRIGLQLVGGTGPVTLYLFHSSQQEPIWSQEFVYENERGMFQWFTPSEDLYLPYISDDTDAGGSWYLCYLQRDLPRWVEALNVTKDWSKEPCSSCGVDNIAVWREITKYIQISPFFTTPWDEGVDPCFGDKERLVYTNTTNYGINCEISVGCDLTDFIIQQRDIFARVLQKQVAANLLRMIAMNPEVRVNRNQMNVGRMDILYELDGNPQGRASGLNYELQQAYKALSLETKGLSRACLACNNKGVRFRIA